MAACVLPVKGMGADIIAAHNWLVDWSVYGRPCNNVVENFTADVKLSVMN